MASVLVAGYYGEGNIGDDALLYGLAGSLSQSGHAVTALSGSPEETQRVLGVNALPRRDLAGLSRAIEAHDVLVFGGGGLLQDATSLRSLLYYCNLIRVAKKAGKKVALLGQGIGPIESFLGKRAAASALKACDLVCVRDVKSQAVARALGATSVELTADLAWLLPPPTAGDEFQLGGMKTVAVSPRPWGKGKFVAELFGELTQILFKNGYVPVLVEMDRAMDAPILDSIAKLHGGRCPELRRIVAPQDMLAKISRVHGVIAMRLHAGVFAAIGGIPPLMLAYDPKVASFAQALGVPSIGLEGVTAARIWDGFQRHMNHAAEARATIATRAEEARGMAQRNVELLDRLLAG